MAGSRLGVLGGVVVVVVLALGTGCDSASPEAEARLAAVKAQGEELDAKLSDIEGRMLGGQALVHQWQELGRRHREVSEVTCQNLTQHVMGMEKNFEHQEEKSRRIRRGRLEASVETVSVKATKGRRSRRN